MEKTTDPTNLRDHPLFYILRQPRTEIPAPVEANDVATIALPEAGEAKNNNLREIIAALKDFEYQAYQQLTDWSTKIPEYVPVIKPLIEMWLSQIAADLAASNINPETGEKIGDFSERFKLHLNKQLEGLWHQLEAVVDIVSLLGTGGAASGVASGAEGVLKSSSLKDLVKNILAESAQGAVQDQLSNDKAPATAPAPAPAAATSVDQSDKQVKEGVSALEGLNCVDLLVKLKEFDPNNPEQTKEIFSFLVEATERISAQASKKLHNETIGQAGETITAILRKLMASPVIYQFLETRLKKSALWQKIIEKTAELKAPQG